MVDGVCLSNGVWGRAFNVCAEQRLSPHIHKTYMLSGTELQRQRPDSLHAFCACVFPPCYPELLVLMYYCAAWWLIMILNVYEHWSAISPTCEPFHILTGHCLTAHWWMHNDLQYDATGRPANAARRHTNTEEHKLTSHQMHRQQILVYLFRHLNYCICVKIIKEVENYRAKQALDNKWKATVIESQL